MGLMMSPGYSATGGLHGFPRNRSSLPHRHSSTPLLASLSFSRPFRTPSKIAAKKGDRMKFTSTTAYRVLVCLGLIFSSHAFAIGGGDPSRGLAMESESRPSVQAPSIKIEGKLFCKVPAFGGAQSCLLEIAEHKSGRTFRLIGDRSAMRLYQTGNLNVAVEGTLQDSETIAVNKTEVL